MHLAYSQCTILKQHKYKNDGNNNDNDGDNHDEDKKN